MLLTRCIVALISIVHPTPGDTRPYAEALQALAPDAAITTGEPVAAFERLADAVTLAESAVPDVERNIELAPTTTAILLRKAGALDALDKALDAPSLALPLDLAQPDVTDYVDIEDFGVSRTATRIQVRRMRAAADRHDPVEDLFVSALKPAQACAQHPTLVSSLVYTATLNLVTSAWVESADIANTTRDGLTEAMSALQTHDPALVFARAAEGERIIAMQNVALIYDRATGHVIPRHLPSLRPHPFRMPSERILRALLPLTTEPAHTAMIRIDRHFDAIREALAATSTDERREALRRADQLADAPYLRSPISTWLGPASAYDDIPARAERSRRLALLHTAALQYHHQTGSPPTSTADLTAANLIDPALLNDPMTDLPLKLSDLDNDPTETNTP